MWPWEHLAVGYLCYSVLVRWRAGRTPGGPEAVALLVGTQFPDLVDKPLAWVLHVLPAGQSLAHSLLFALPTVGVVLLLRRSRRPGWGAAFAVGYLSHLPCDVLYPVLLGGPPSYAFLLWPVVPVTPVETVSIVALLRGLAGAFAERLASPAGVGYLLFEVGLLATALAVWFRDGAPGVDLFADGTTAILPGER